MTIAASKGPILFISDQPERFAALRRSALAGRTVHLWMANGRAAPEWSVGLHGDPTRPATYAAVGGRDMPVVVDLGDEAWAKRVARSVRRALPHAPVVVIDRERGRRHGSTRGGVTWIDEGELLADAIEGVLERAEGRRRVDALAQALRGADRCAFLVQHDPDPDAIASALALRAVLGFPPDRSPIVTCGRVTRPENRRLVSELRVRVQHVTSRQVAAMEPLVLVDVQPTYFGGLLPEVAAVVDHHPPAGAYRARYRDVRTSYGASATMAAEYLLAAGNVPLTRPLATALLYGIITDTKSLSRATSEEDLQMFAYLFPRADHAALRRIQHPSYAPLVLRRFGGALERARVHGGLAYVHLGRLPKEQEHVVAQLAEFCLGMAGAAVSAVSGVFGPRLVMSTRALSHEARLGDRLSALFGAYGSAGGHPTMAKAVVRLADWRADHPYRDDRGLERSVLRVLRGGGVGQRSRGSGRAVARPPAHQRGFARRSASASSRGRGGEKK